MTKMFFNNISRRAFVLLAASAALPVMGQQLHESISVDGKYVPDVIKIDRINVFPKAMKPVLMSSPLAYEEDGVAAAFSHSLLTMPATGWNASRMISDNPGYLELGAGSWLNSTVSAGYRFVDNSSTLFGARLQHNSTSLWKPELSPAAADVRQKRYDESLGLYGSQIFRGLGRLDASIDYHVGYFNYYGFLGTERPMLLDGFDPFPPGTTPDIPPVTPGIDVPDGVKAPTQTINDIAFRADWHSLITPASSLDWHATARMRHFAYRRVFLPDNPLSREKGGRETNVGLAAGVRMPWDNGSSIGLDADLEMVFLGSVDAFDKLDDYGMLTLTPYYRFTKGMLDIRLGADIDMAFNAGAAGNRYSFFHIAPDVRFGVQTGQVGIYLNLLGGSELNTLAHLHELDYYSMPAAITTRPSYTPLDAAFGVNLGPFSGFSLGLEARYRATKNVPLGGWYQVWLNLDNTPFVGLLPEVSSKATVNYCNDPDGLNLHGASFSGKISYDQGQYFSISAEGSYQPQDGKKGYFNGYDRARVTAAFKASVKPMEQLTVSAGYDYRGVRKIYVNSYETLADGIMLTQPGTLHSLRLSDLTLLNLSASWSFTPDFSVWLQADNLLNRHDAVLPMQPTQGIVFAGGFKWLF